MKSKLEETFPDAKVKLVEGGGGNFDVIVDGKVVFSKNKSGRFPNETEIIQLLKR